MKTIEELGQLARDTWNAYFDDDRHRLAGLTPAEGQLEAGTAVAKAIVTAIADDGVSWAPGDD